MESPILRFKVLTRDGMSILSLNWDPQQAEPLVCVHSVGANLAGGSDKPLVGLLADGAVGEFDHGDVVEDGKPDEALKLGGIGGQVGALQEESPHLWVLGKQSLSRLNELPAYLAAVEIALIMEDGAVELSALGHAGDHAMVGGYAATSPDPPGEGRRISADDAHLLRRLQGRLDEGDLDQAGEEDRHVKGVSHGAVEVAEIAAGAADHAAPLSLEVSSRLDDFLGQRRVAAVDALPRCALDHPVSDGKVVGHPVGHIAWDGRVPVVQEEDSHGKTRHDLPLRDGEIAVLFAPADVAVVAFSVRFH